MKRLSLIFAALMLAILPSIADDGNATITLSHNGITTTFPYNQPYAAVDNAVDGDTIYFGAGKVEGDFTLTKKLTFIGVGADREYHSEINGYYPYTEYSGNIVINLPENTKLASRLFEGIYFSWASSDITFQTFTQNVMFKKCYISRSINNGPQGINGLYFDRCEIADRICSSIWYVNNVICRNCKLRDSGAPNRYAQNWHFYNCTFTNLSIYGSSAPDGTSYNYCGECQGIFVNCIFNSHYNDDYRSLPLFAYRSDYPETTIASFTNCLFYPQIEELGVDMFAPGTTTSEIMYYTKKDDSSNAIEFLTKEELEQNNYFGTDGTVVGCYGGKNPFSLHQSQAKISSAKVHLDKEEGNIQIKVNVSVTQ